MERLSPGARGLDYGCGAAPALAVMLTEAGFPSVGYDPFFAPEAAWLEARYAFVTCTKVLEHMHAPTSDLARIDALLEPCGWLGLMTELRPPRDDFSRWHYHRDPTHVGFYSNDSLQWIARRFGWQVQSATRRVILLAQTGMSRAAFGRVCLSEPGGCAMNDAHGGRQAEVPGVTRPPCLR